MSLVHYSQGMKEECAMWAARGVQFRESSLVVHLPALPLALLDLVISKDAAVLRAAANLSRTVLWVVVYVAIYLSVIITNYRLSGRWPYSFMNALGVDPVRWAKFIATQLFVILTLVLMNWLVLLVKTR